MKVLREVKMNVSNAEVGDRIKVKLPGETHTATAVLKDGDGVLFVFDECLDDARPMNENGGTEGGYLESDLRKVLKEIARGLPKKLQKRMIPDENGDSLWLLSLQEVCGVDTDWNEVDGQIEWMKERRHRVAYRKNECEWYWLRDVVSGAYFAIVAGSGDADHYNASDTHGVRPAFKIRNL